MPPSGNTLRFFQPRDSIDPDLGRHVYPGSNTPFVLLYDDDDAELRIQVILHTRAGRSRIDASDVDW